MNQAYREINLQYAVHPSLPIWGDLEGLYAPFGEIMTEYNPGWQSGVIPKYSFNAKELDEENGMYYYSARYYDPNGTFISRDVMFEKYFWLSPYCYTANNPLRYVDPTGMDWYESTELNSNGQKSVFWQKGNAATIDVDGVKYNNIGENYTSHKGNVSTTYEQDVAISLTERVLSPDNFQTQMNKDGTQKAGEEGNCFYQAGVMVKSTGTTSLGGESNNISNMERGLDYINGQVSLGYSVRVHVDRTNDGSGDHWVAISSRTTNLLTGEISFGFYDPGTSRPTAGTNNTFNVNGNTMIGRPTYNPMFLYNVVNVRKNR